MRWHRRLIARKWTYTAKRVGRPGLRRTIATLIVRLARENDRWGDCRIQGELKKIGHRVAARTVGKVLKAHGIRPAPGAAHLVADVLARTWPASRRSLTRPSWRK